MNQLEVQDLEALFELSLDMICVAGTDAMFKKVNPAFTDTLGYTEEELLSKPFLEFVHPEDIEATLAEVGRLSEGLPTVSFRNRYRHADGHYLVLHWKAAPRGDRTYALARDVTEEVERERELAEREAMLRAVVENAADALITFDGDGTVLSANLAAGPMFGAELVGRDVRELLVGVRPDRGLDRALDTVRRMGRVTLQTDGGRADGGTFPARVRISGVPGGRSEQFLAIASDITELRKAEQMESALLANDALQRGRIETAVGILHDLGNALTGVATRTHSVQRSLVSHRQADRLPQLAEFTAAQREALVQALGEARGAALVDLVAGIASDAAAGRDELLEHTNRSLDFIRHAQQLLSSHRTYAGMSPQLEEIDVPRLLRDVQVMMSESMEKRGGALVVHYPKALPTVTVEQTKLVQVLLNLVKNGAEAIDAARPDAPEVELSARLGVGRLLIEVRDNGSGFTGDPELLFEHGHSTKQRGSGFGLSTSRRIIESIDGTLTLISEGAGRGATATISLPIAKNPGGTS